MLGLLESVANESILHPPLWETGRARGLVATEEVDGLQFSRSLLLLVLLHLLLQKAYSVADGGSLGFYFRFLHERVLHRLSPQV